MLIGPEVIKIHQQMIELGKLAQSVEWKKIIKLMKEQKSKIPLNGGIVEARARANLTSFINLAEKLQDVKETMDGIDFSKKDDIPPPPNAA